MIGDGTEKPLWLTKTRGRVLIVDDDQANRRLLQLLLEEEKFDVTTASSGEECLDRARASSPEVILLDIRMPGMDGVETCRRLKQSFETVNIPVVFITGHDDDDPIAVEALRAGGNDFISKESSKPIFVARLMSQISISRAHTRLRRMAMQDELTGVLTRRCLLDSLRRSMIAGGGTKMSCMVIDVDELKAYNEAEGHMEGDQMLRRVARTIESYVSQSDLVGRFDSDEFVVIADSESLESAVRDADEVRKTVENKCTPLTVSVGVAQVTTPASEEQMEHSAVEDCIKNLVQRAEDAMLVAKSNGRNAVVAAKD